MRRILSFVGALLGVLALVALAQWTPPPPVAVAQAVTVTPSPTATIDCSSGTPVVGGTIPDGVVCLPTATPTRTPTVTPTATRNPAQCHPSYPTVCIPPPPPDLNCPDITHRNFTVLPPDPHNFDTDNDGIGCET